MNAVTLETTPGHITLTKKFGENAIAWSEHGTFFVGLQYEQGRLVLGYGDTVKVAYDRAVQHREG